MPKRSWRYFQARERIVSLLGQKEEVQDEISLHKNATTTPALRKIIQESTLSERKLAQKYGISRTTVRKWKERDFVHDAPIKPRNPHTSLNPEEEFA